ncbi:MAG: 16S rRNA (cytosine(967)-C(5))-methyltransferase RsmB [Ignavibacteriales bacterium]
MTTRGYSARDVALEVLRRVEERDAYADISLDSFLQRHRLSGPDRALATELVYGVCRRRNTLDWVIEKASSRPVGEMTGDVRNALRMGVYQLMYLDRIPAHAAVNESVEAVKSRGRPGAARFTNAVLRNVAAKPPEPDREGSLAIRYSHPEWLVEHFASELGLEAAQRLMDADNRTPPYTVRVNALKAGVGEVECILRERGVAAAGCRFVPEGLWLPEGPGDAGVEAHRRGLVQAQDEGSMLVSRVLAPEPGEFVIDACAAPGGKTTHIAQLMGNRGRIVAADIHPSRLGLVRKVCGRLGVTIVEDMVCDSRSLRDRMEGLADRVLVDAPCSGLGTLRRRPDARWRKDAMDARRLSVLQVEILLSAADCLRPGGCLVYSTCTIGREENQDVVRRFLEARDDFFPDDIRSCLPESLRGDASGEGYIQLLPHVHGTDGFFICRMRRSG